MIFVMTMMYEIKVDNWRTCIFYLPDLLGWPDLARRVNSHHVRGCLFAIWSWQEKYFMRIRALSWNLLICQLISNELKFQISKRSELLLRRYLQNNIDFLKTLIFNVFFMFSQFRTSKVVQGGKLLNGYAFFWKLDIKMSQYHCTKYTCLRLYVETQPEQ